MDKKIIEEILWQRVLDSLKKLRETDTMLKKILEEIKKKKENDIHNRDIENGNTGRG